MTNPELYINGNITFNLNLVMYNNNNNNILLLYLMIFIK